MILASACNLHQFKAKCVGVGSKADEHSIKLNKLTTLVPCSSKAFTSIVVVVVLVVINYRLLALRQ